MKEGFADVFSHSNQDELGFFSGITQEPSSEGAVQASGSGEKGLPEAPMKSFLVCCLD